MSDAETRTAAEYPKDKCIHELFCEQAVRTPDSPALIFEDQVFTYRQVDEMSNSLAHTLREIGVGRNDIVPIIAKRSWHIVVAMLGIFKAGGAYMPVDPDYPEDRIKYMLSESFANAKFTAPWWHRILPLGRPVDPDVKMIPKLCSQMNYMGK